MIVLILTANFMLSGSPVFKYIFELFWNPRSNPALMFFLEGVAKLATLVLVADVAILQFIPGPQYQWQLQSGEIGLYVMISSGVLYEAGQLQDVITRNSTLSPRRVILKYFKNIWNQLDIAAYILILYWAFGQLANEPARANSGRIALALSAIPLSFTMFQYLSVSKPLGRLVIMIVAMLCDLLTFIWVFLVAILGFGITLNSLFHLDPTNEFRTAGYTFMYMFSALLGNTDYSPFPPPSQTNAPNYNADVEHVGVVVYISFIVIVGIVLVNLLVARMASTHNRIESTSKAEWGYFWVSLLLSLSKLPPKQALI